MKIQTQSNDKQSCRQKLQKQNLITLHRSLNSNHQFTHMEGTLKSEGNRRLEDMDYRRVDPWANNSYCRSQGGNVRRHSSSGAQHSFPKQQIIQYDLSMSQGDSLVNPSIIYSTPPRTVPYSKFIPTWQLGQTIGCPLSLYVSILGRAIRYMQKPFHTFLDDAILLQQLSPHICINNCTNPVPLNKIGQRLLKCGYVLAAYSLLMARLNRSEVVYYYLIGVFQGYWNVQENYNQLVDFAKTQRNRQWFGFEQLDLEIKAMDQAEQICNGYQNISKQVKINQHKHQEHQHISKNIKQQPISQIIPIIDYTSNKHQQKSLKRQEPSNYCYVDNLQHYKRDKKVQRFNKLQKPIIYLNVQQKNRVFRHLKLGDRSDNV